MLNRHTVVVSGQLARTAAELQAARDGQQGCQILSMNQLAARLAGGFLLPVSRPALLEAVSAALGSPDVALGEIDAIRNLPGTPRAAAATLGRFWAADIQADADATSGKKQSGQEQSGRRRLMDVLTLEAAVVERLPANMLCPPALVRCAIERVALAPAVLGDVEVRGVPDLDPVWRPLLLHLAATVTVSWRCGVRREPAWLRATAVAVDRAEPTSPGIERVSCANPRHEALEALRWARELVATGAAGPHEIAIASPNVSEWEAHLQTVGDDANLPLAFLHGRPALTTREGQCAAALAETLLRGVGRAYVERVLRLCRGMTAATEALPNGWHRVLPAGAALPDLQHWERALANVQEWPDGKDFSAGLLDIVRVLERGESAAQEAGAMLLGGRALGIWQRALLEGPARGLGVSLSGLRLDDAADPCTSIVICSAEELANAPRRFAWLLGLTSRAWPRSSSEDPLLPPHVVAARELDPVPVAERDVRDFAALLASTGEQVVLSRSRRDAGGRKSGSSGLLNAVSGIEERLLQLRRIPAHAVSETDRLLARAAEFAATDRAVHAAGCWTDWHRPVLTAHDGLVRANHPVVAAVLERTFSATSLRLLVRNPLGYLWQYAFGWSAPDEQDTPLALDAAAFGSLVHRVLSLAATGLAGRDSVPSRDTDLVQALVDTALAEAADEFEAEQPVPPRLIWQRTLQRAADMAVRALTWEEAPLPGQRTYVEVPFGGLPAEPDGEWPWDPDAPVVIEGTGLRIRGGIDRLDISADGSEARVTDYKTGKAAAPVLAGGSELQRCLYACAVRALLDGDPAVDARLLYLRDEGGLAPLDDPRSTLATLAAYLEDGRRHALAGHALPGPEAANWASDALTFAFPANAKNGYLGLKREAAAERLAPLPELWEME